MKQHRRCDETSISDAYCRVGSRYIDGYKQRTPKISLRGSENGGYLLSHDCSTIGVAELNDPVRNGKGWDLSAITT